MPVPPVSYYEPEEGEHYPECIVHNGIQAMRGDDEICICPMIACERLQEAAERRYDYMREND